ncbi:T9SS type A sorting domain-containing protein [Nostoc sp. NIES-2111]
MKKLLLSAIILGSAIVANAQSGGYSVSPMGATGSDLITITLDPAVVCTDGTPGLAGVALVRMHSGWGDNASPTPTNWQNVVDAGPTGAGDAVVGMTQNPDGTWSKTFRPSDYYGVAGGDIARICAVFNGGATGANWDNRGKYDDGSGTCGDLFIPLPVAAPFGVTATKKINNNNFSLKAAFPNPTNNESAIRVTLKQSGNVTVTVKNLIGQTVATLANGFMTAGDKSFTWEAGNNPSGIYFYTVESEGATASAKINLVK